jgi:hypothetical protein
VNIGSDATLLKGGHPRSLAGLDEVDTGRHHVSVRSCFMSTPAVSSLVFFRIGGELRVSLPPPARGTDTREHRTVRGAPRLRVAKPVPGGGQVGLPDQAPVSAGAGFNPGRVRDLFSYW